MNMIYESQSRKPLHGISAFEKLRTEWIAANPDHSEQDLLGACVTFAKVTGLILRERLLQAQIDQGGWHE